MIIALALGFLLTAAAGLVAWARGRRSAAALLIVAGSVAMITVASTLGRDGVSDFTLGTLVGLPVLMAGLMTWDRRARARQKDLGVRSPDDVERHRSD